MKAADAKIREVMRTFPKIATLKPAKKLAATIRVFAELKIQTAIRSNINIATVKMCNKRKASGVRQSFQRRRTGAGKNIRGVMAGNMQNPYQKIIEMLDTQGVKYEIAEHEPVYTSEQAARVRNESVNTGAKSLLLKADNNFVLTVLPGGKRLSSKKLKDFLGLKSLRFATPQEVKEIMGCEIGACYPLGRIIGIKTIVDNVLLENNEISFNPGLHDKTIKLKSRDYLSIADAEMADIYE